jgi:tetratricopeptide (TPR) repeat protein
MIRIIRNRHRSCLRGSIVPLLMALTFAAPCTGCKNWAPSWVHAPDVKKVKDQRLQTAAESFERQRNEAQIRAARSALKQGNHDICKQQLESLLTRSPDHREANYLLIDAMLRSGNIASARAQAESLVARWPNDPDALHALGQVHEIEGDEQRSLACFEKAASVATGEPVSSSDQAMSEGMLAKDPAVEASLLKAEVCLALDRREDVVAYLDEVFEYNPDLAEAHLLAGRLLTADGKTDEAAAHFEAASGHRDDVMIAADEAMTTDPAVALASARSDVESDKRTKIIRIGEEPAAMPAGPQRVATQMPERTLHVPAPVEDAKTAENEAVALAIAALRHDDPSRSILLSQSALKLYPKSAALHRILGAAHFRLGDYEASRTALEQSLALDANQGVTYFLLGTTLAKLGDAEGSERHLAHARQMDARYASKPEQADRATR